jgi:hypothetical protein
MKVLRPNSQTRGSLLFISVGGFKIGAVGDLAIRALLVLAGLASTVVVAVLFSRWAGIV